ncbi:hypothetical protein [Gemmatimonas sp.]|uniref:hypothetical protein n=1 Tax=Gemmatimonas sp. TaxID=1962908 RepID=UPI0035678D6E
MHRRTLLNRFTRVLPATAASVISAAVLSAQSPAKVAIPARFTSLPGANAISAFATDYAFDMPSSVPAGLTTIRFSNKGKEFPPPVSRESGEGEEARGRAGVLQVRWTTSEVDVAGRWAERPGSR